MPKAFYLLLFLPLFFNGQDGIVTDFGKISIPGPAGDYHFIHNRDLYVEKLDTLPRTLFWRKLVRLSPDSAILSFYSDRKIISTEACSKWEKMSEVRQKAVRDSIKTAFGRDSSEKVLFTKGKSDFYKIEDVVADITRGILVFENNGVDPFYAQAILLIESPGRLQKSPVGAYGPFQIMKKVGLRIGLTINAKVDERADFDRAAWAAAKLIRTVCIPYTNAMLEKRGMAWCETDLWYRLLVLHTYHAGAGNVEKVLAAINPEVGNMDLIKKIWVTKAGAFGNSSQNYSQLAIATLLELDKLMGYQLSLTSTSQVIE
jgi:hypothetical protein